MTSVNVTENKYSVSVTEGATTVVTAKAPGPQGPGFPDGNLGDVTSSNTGASVVVNSGAITNAKVNDSAAIAGTKISPDFGSQNITTTGNAVFGGNLTVSGTTTTIDTTTLRVEDKNIELGKVGSPTDITADGGGITLLGDTNHTFNWLNATDSWTSSEHIGLPDNKKLQLGDSQDLEIFHDGSSHSYFRTTAGGIIVKSFADLQFRSDNIQIKSAALENYITCTANGSVELYYDNVKKLETTNNGVTVNGNLLASSDGNTSINILDTGHGFSASTLSLSNGGRDLDIKAPKDIRLKPTDGESGIVIEANGQVELYYDNVKKAETASNGLSVEGTVTCDDILLANSITHEGQTNTKISFDATAMNFISNGVQRFSVTQYAVFMQQGFKLAFIAASGENPYIRSTGTNNGDLEIGQGTESMAQFKRDGAVELYYNGVEKLKTQSWGVNLTGTLNTNNVTSQGYSITNGDFLPSSDNNNDLGSSTKRFSTLHSVSLNTGDINMSNLNNNGNDVDGSKGSWSLQEGADDLFIINRVSGKKYKFNLTEIN